MVSRSCLEDLEAVLDNRAVVKFHVTSLDNDWVNPWQARVTGSFAAARSLG